MKEGTIVELNYTARELSKNEVFDTTIEEVAIKEGVFAKNKKYMAMVVVVGENELPEPLENALKEMNNGEEKTVRLSPEQAFGKRSPELVAVAPLKEFRQRKIQPVPGLVVELDGRIGRVQSVSGGRVRIDFNHPLAGKEIEYKVKIEKVIEKPKEQLQALFEKYFSSVPEKERSITQKEGTVEVKISGKSAENLAHAKQLFAEKATKHIKGIEKLRFVEEFEKQAETKKVVF